MELLFIRHGEDLGAVKGIIADMGLTEQGKKQIQNMKSVTNDFKPDYIISSPLKRALETAEILNEECNKQIEINDLLTEMNFLNLQDIDKDELLAFNTQLDNNNGYINVNHKIEKGESHQDLIIRVRKFWEELNKNNQRKNSRFLIIAHGRILTFIISYIMDFKLDGYRFVIPNAGFLKLVVNETWRPQISFNSLKH